MTPAVSVFLQAALRRISTSISAKEIASTHVGIEVLDGQQLSIGIEILPAHEGEGFRACLHGIGIRGGSEELHASSAGLLMGAIQERMLYAPGEWHRIKVTTMSIPRPGYSFVPALVGDSQSGRMVSLAPHLVDFLGTSIDKAAQLVISGKEEAADLLIKAGSTAESQVVKFEMLQLADCSPSLIVSFAQHRYRAEINPAEACPLDGKNRVLSFLSTQFAGNDTLCACILGKTTRTQTTDVSPGSEDTMPGTKTGEQLET